MDELVIETFFSPVSSSEESSDESEVDEMTMEEQIFKMSPQKIVKISLYVENVTRSYNQKVFQMHFRMSRITVYEILIRRLENSEYTPSNLYGKEKVTSEKSFLLVLWYLSNKETFREVSDRFDVSLSSAHRILQRVLKFLLSLRRDYIKWPTGDEIATVCANFRRKKNFDNVIGAIDGCHIRIKKPLRDADSYINRKGYYSILLQGIVNTQKCFTDAYCGEPGNIHDARLLRKSNIYIKGQQEPEFFGNKFILGDSAYPSLRWLVPPFKDNGALTERHRQFNYRHSATRIVVEHAFGLLKGRFRRLHIIENNDLKTAAKIVMGCCILHNICQITKDPVVIEPYNIEDDVNAIPEVFDFYRGGGRQ